jgi:integrase/recombinase XerD
MKKPDARNQSPKTKNKETDNNEFNLLPAEEWEQIQAERIAPKEMAKKLVKLLRPNRPDYLYLKQVFKHTRQMLDVTVEKSRKRLPELLTDTELIAFYEAVWNARNTNHLVLIKLLIYTGIRNAELTRLEIKDVDPTNCSIRIEQGKGKKDRYVLFPMSFRGELAQYIEKQKRQGAKFLFESNRLNAFSTRRIRQIIKQYADESGIEKRIYPHLFRHQIITYLTRKGIISPKLQLLSGHSEEKSLAIYRDLALADVAEEYESAMQMFPIR